MMNVTRIMNPTCPTTLKQFAMKPLNKSLYYFTATPVSFNRVVITGGFDTSSQDKTLMPTNEVHMHEIIIDEWSELPNLH